MKLIAGIDGGGTKTTVRCQSLEGELLGQGVFGPLNLNSIGAAAVEECWEEILAFLKSKGECQALCIGAAGAGNPQTERLVKTAMEKAGISRWRLVGDHEIALAGALEGQPGCVLIAGTGSVCCGRNDCGEVVRVGGWGHLIGDEGSGYAIGKDVFGAVAAQLDGAGEKTILTKLVRRTLGLGSREEILQYVYGKDKQRIAAAAPLCTEAAREGDQTAAEILRDNAQKLSRLAQTAVRRLSLDEGEIALMGGMLENDGLFRRETAGALAQLLPGFRCIRPKRTAAEGAVMLAEALLGQAGEQSGARSGISLPGTCLGVDIGGETIKFAVLRERQVEYTGRIKTAGSAETILEDIVGECRRLEKRYNVKAVGVGTPGSIREGRVFASNLPFQGLLLEELLMERLDIPVTVENDANCAALGEMAFGEWSDHCSMVLITLGTGIGGGIILDGRLRRGHGRMGEIGHMIVQQTGGLPCPCGNTGCWERYASGAALVRQAKEAALAHEDSILHERYVAKGERFGGEDVFAALEQGCSVAGAVWDTYLTYLAVGIESLNNILDPDGFVLAGGITAQGDKLLLPLNEKLGKGIRVEISRLQGDAGALGAAILEREKGVVNGCR